MKSAAKINRRYIYMGIVVLGAALLFGLVWFWQSRFNVVPQLVASISQTEDMSFPDVDETALSARQSAVVTLLRQEYEAQRPGEYYSQGETQPWCANFVSWVMLEVGAPLENPHTDSWRIPGTYTLREYYERVGRFRSVDTGYTPKIGDTILYDNPGPFGQHVNFVVAYDDGVVTTVGGNENSRVRVQQFTLDDMQGVVGFGLL